MTSMSICINCCARIQYMMSIRSRTNFREHIYESRSNRRRMLPKIFRKRRGTVVSYAVKIKYWSYIVRQWRENRNSNITYEIRNFDPQIFDAVAEMDFPIHFGVIWGDIGCHMYYRGVDSLWHTVDSLSPSNLCSKPSNLCEFEKHRRIFVTNRRIFATTVDFVWRPSNLCLARFSLT